MAASQTTGYAGEISVAQAYAALEKDPQAVLVDVRTQAEWAFVGVPDLAKLGKKPILAEWQTYPEMMVAPDFVTSLEAVLKARGARQDAPIYFICRSGARSRHAAVALTAAGWKRCFNVTEGFEGPLDPTGHRGNASGWKAAGLPWSQS